MQIVKHTQSASCERKYLAQKKGLILRLQNITDFPFVWHNPIWYSFTSGCICVQFSPSDFYLAVYQTDSGVAVPCFVLCFFLMSENSVQETRKFSKTPRLFVVLYEKSL